MLDPFTSIARVDHRNPDGTITLTLFRDEHSIELEEGDTFVTATFVIDVFDSSTDVSPSHLGRVVDGRHPSTVQLARYFEYSHLREPMRTVSARCADTAEAMIRALPDGPELTAGLRKLLEAKDCFVRASLDTEHTTTTKEN